MCGSERCNECTFHPSVVEVENRAFEDCNNLREAVFNDVLQEIGNGAFHDCTYYYKRHTAIYCY